MGSKNSIMKLELTEEEIGLLLTNNNNLDRMTIIELYEEFQVIKSFKINE